jgi:dipeptidyl aminopeptidase/acylaminoacyl peptidase
MRWHAKLKPPTWSLEIMKHERTTRGRGLLLGLALSLLFAGSAWGQVQTVSYLDDLPPLVDREVFFGNPELAYGGLSPDGQYVSIVKPLDGIQNVWVRRIDQSWEEAWPVTNERDRPVIQYFWSQDGKHILYVQDKGGDENFRVYAVDPAAKPAPGEKVPPARDLTPYEEVQARIIVVPESSPRHILIGLNDRNPQLHDVYRLNIETGERELILLNDANVADWVADLEGNLRLGVRVTEDGGTEILRVDGTELTPVFTCTVDETCDPIRFHKNGRQLYLSTNQGNRELAELVLLDPETGATELVDRDPEGEVDFSNAIFSRATDELLATSYTGARLRIYPKNATFEKDLAVIRAALPRGDLLFRQPTRDDRLWIVKPILDTDNGPNYLYDRATGKVELLYRPYPNIPIEHMAEMEAVTYTARDGVEIPAYLTLPKGVEPRNLAVVIMPHGGPWARDTWGWNPLAQLLANRGYAVLQPNFRGSTGYGKNFLELGNGQWGTGSMQHDITDGVAWLIEQGIADPSRIAIMGGSYGGYATLAGVTFTPDVYAAGVSIVGPSSIITLLNSIPPYWVPIKKLFHARVGNPEDPADLERLRAQSPLYSAADITAPLMVIQGANDPRVKQSESDQIVAALRDLGRTVEYLVAPDEGHGFANELNDLASYAAMERFLAEHVGGRYQGEMRPEIADKLEAITVDIETVDVGMRE